MGTNYRKKQSYLETCSVRVSFRSVIRKPAGKICDDVRVILRPILEQIWPWEGPWDHPGTTLDPDLKKVPKIIKKIPFLDLILETFFHQVFFIFFAVLNYAFGNPANQFLKDFGVILSQFLE